MFNLLAMMEWDFDVSIIEFFNQLIQVGTPFHEGFKMIFKLISYLGTEIVFIVVIGMTYWGINKKIGKEVGSQAFFAMIFNNVLKGFFNRFRPFQQSPSTIECGDTSILREVPQGTEGAIEVDGKFFASTVNDNGEKILYATSLSFPSGHANGSSAVYNSYALSIEKKWAWIVSSCLCVLVMLSRMVLGAHFLTDVLTGYLTGLLFILLVYFLKKKCKNEYVIYYILIAVFGIITFLSPLFSDTPKDLFSTYGIAFGMVFGCKFEEKFVNFKDTKCWWKIVLRTIIGGALLFGIKEGLKLPYKWMDPSYLTYFFDFLRYAIMLFVGVAIYPIFIKKMKWLND